MVTNDVITNQYECNQTLDVSAWTRTRQSRATAMLRSGSKLVQIVVPSAADKTATSEQELELLCSHHINHTEEILSMIQPELEGITQGHSIVRNSRSLGMMAMNVYKEMPTKIELTLEQSDYKV
ncbi:hypothetical protein Tco_1570201 [Tanacetum coccineum]